MLEEETACSGCGLPLEETTAPGAEGQYTVTEYLCAGCQVRAAAAQDDKAYGGRLLHVHRKPDQPTEAS